MSIQHDAITDPKIHEPKGASTATAETTYVANGGGSGTWQRPLPRGSDTALLDTIPYSDGAGGIAWKHNISSVHGEIYVSTGAIAVGPTGGTITNDADYRAVGGTWILNPDSDNVSLHANNYSIQIGVTGHYYLDAFVTFSTGATANGTQYALKYRVNGSATLSTRRVITAKSTNAVEYRSLHGAGLVALNAGDYINLMLGSSVADTITVTDAGITVLYLHE